MKIFKYYDLEVPEEFILEDEMIHYKVNLIEDDRYGWIFQITHENGSFLKEYLKDPSYIFYFSPEKLLNRKLIACSFEKFNKMKVFA